MHFCSPELITDSVNPLYQTFTGPIDQVVRNIFARELSIDRKTSTGLRTSLEVVGATANQVKFTSPGWRPVQCINWLASKALGRGYKNPGYLFYESNKKFYFANIEALIDRAIQASAVYQNYVYVAKRLTSDPDSIEYVQNINDDYSKVTEMRVVQSFNFLDNLNNGYYANKLFSLDLQTKDYNRGLSYNHTVEYPRYKHLENIKADGRPGAGTSFAPFSDVTIGEAGAHVNFYPKHRNLYTGFTNNVADIIESTMPQRTSTLHEINNFKIEITVPGRTDIEVGAIINFIYPDARPRDETQKVSEGIDEMYSGYYLVTAIRHKFTLNHHVMILEISKDSLKRKPGTISEQ
jgi:hypothetical protein